MVWEGGRVIGDPLCGFAMVWWFGVGFGWFGNGLGWLGVVWDGLRRFGVGLEWFEKCWGAKA